MKSNQRTHLLSLDRRVYLYFANTAVWDIFVAQATAEGFLWCDYTKLSEKGTCDIIAMNQNMTFNFVGFVGHMRFKSADEGIIRVDFAKYRNGAEAYILHT